MTNINKTRGISKMPELSRGDFLDAFKEQARSIDQHSRDTLAAINGLANEIRGLAQAKSAPHKSEKNGITQMLGMAAVVFGLMTPMYILVQASSKASMLVTDSIKKDIETISRAMRMDDVRERSDAAQMARQASSLIEVETQFNDVHRRLGDIQDRMESDNQREYRDAATVSDIRARLKFLESNKP